MDMCHLDPETSDKAQKKVDELAAKGYRTLGVARSKDEGAWEFLGILPLLDPPREDSADTIADARKHGIEIKMVTGDDVAIGREISRKVGLGDDIQPATQLFKEDTDVEHLSPEAITEIEAAADTRECFRSTSTPSSERCSPGDTSSA